MAEMEVFPRELDRIEQRIAALHEYLYEAELYPEQIRFWAKLRRAVSLFLVRRYVLRQIQQLCLQRRMIRNCCLYAHKREPDDRLTVENTRTVSTHHP